MKLGLATLAAVVALVATTPAEASTPQPWCGTAPSARDLLPDVTQAYAVHVAYVRAPGVPDRFAEWVPRLVGDAAAIDAWWRGQDPTRTPRFDLFAAPACASTFGALDVSDVELPQAPGDINAAFQSIRLQLSSEAAFREPEKAYLVYFDGSTGQTGEERVCGQGAEGGSFGLPGIAIVYLDSCSASAGDSLRPVIAIHELTHVFGAVEDAAPHSCQSGHVCDAENDLMGWSLTGNELDAHVLDAGRDDYYGHGGTWPDVRDSFFLEPLDSADRTAPATPFALRAGDDSSGLVRFSWGASSDDVGPVAYRVYQDERFVRQVTATSLLLTSPGGISRFGVRAVDAAGRLSPIAGARFRDGAGMVDASGRLIRDTVRPPAISRVAIRHAGKSVRVSWSAVRDAGGLRGYRVKIGARTVNVTKPAVALAVARVTGSVSFSAVDRAGNVGPALVVPRTRLR